MATRKRDNTVGPKKKKAKRDGGVGSKKKVKRPTGVGSSKKAKKKK